MHRILSHRAIWWFAVTSLTLHLLLLAGVKKSPDVATTPYLGLPWVHVRLENRNGGEPSTAAKNRTKARPLSDEIYNPFPAAEIQSSAIEAQPLPDLSDTATGQRSWMTEGVSEVTLHNQLSGLLQTRLSRYLVYPPLARSRGWEGTVLLGLRMEPDGQLERIRIERGSGYPVLDDSALHSLKRLGHLVEAGVWLNGRSIDMQLPVIYKLIDN